MSIKQPQLMFVLEQKPIERVPLIQIFGEKDNG